MRQSPRDKYHITVWRARWTLGRRGQLVRFSLDRFGFPLRKQPQCFLVEHANNVFINLDEFSGVFFIGLGDEFMAEKLEAYPPGAVIFLPGNTPHFHWAKSGDYVAQVTAIGPLGVEYLNPQDDPRRLL